MTAWDFITIIFKDLMFEFRITMNDTDEWVVFVSCIEVKDLAEYITDIKEKTGLTPKEIGEESGEYELGYTFKKAK